MPGPKFECGRPYCRAKFKSQLRHRQILAAQLFDHTSGQAADGHSWRLQKLVQPSREDAGPCRVATQTAAATAANSFVFSSPKIGRLG